MFHSGMHNTIITFDDNNKTEEKEAFMRADSLQNSAKRIRVCLS